MASFDLTACRRLPVASPKVSFVALLTTWSVQRAATWSSPKKYPHSSRANCLIYMQMKDPGLKNFNGFVDHKTVAIKLNK